MRRVMIITWVSASWKTTLQEKLLERWWKRPINFTTRKPRNDFEYNEYVFLTREQFLEKLNNGDFLEFTNYWWNFYWVSNMFKTWKVEGIEIRNNLGNDLCIILDPVWRAQVMEKLSRENIEIIDVYINISPELQRERLENRWDWEDEVIKRSNDFKWFHPTDKSIILDGSIDVDLLVWELEFIINNKNDE